MNRALLSFSILSLLTVSALAEPKVYSLEDSGPDVQIPKKIWSEVKSVGKNDSVTFASIKVRMVEKTSGVLVDPEIEITLPRGGGQVDLAKFVRDQRGTFSVFFEPEDQKEDKDLKVYFVSQAKKRKIDDEIWGAGCNKYMDLTAHVMGKPPLNGIEVNTTRNRHLSVLGGSFVFVSGHQISQVGFTDTSQAQLFCTPTTVKKTE